MLRKRKKAVSLVLMAFLFLLPSTISFAQVCGDVDCSGGDPDISDIARLIDYLYLSHDPLCDPKLADVNDSGGEPDMSDITALINHLYLTHEPLICPPPAVIMDIDGNRYHTIKIGDQWWLKENLRVTRYRNGYFPISIPLVTDDDIWETLTTGAYCYYDNDEGNVSTYGLLYNWYAITDSLAPQGWHIPSDEEWKILERSLGMSKYYADMTGWRGIYNEGGKLKESGTVHWNNPNSGATNESGFTALPGGYRWRDGSYLYLNEFAVFWTSTEAVWRHLVAQYNMIYRGVANDKRDGQSIRCVRD